METVLVHRWAEAGGAECECIQLRTAALPSFAPHRGQTDFLCLLLRPLIRGWAGPEGRGWVALLIETRGVPYFLRRHPPVPLSPSCVSLEATPAGGGGAGGEGVGGVVV